MVRAVVCWRSIADRIHRPSRRRGRVLVFLVALCAGLLFHILYTGENRDPDETIQHLNRRTHAGRAPVDVQLEFPDEYHARGVLSLPYGDIVEPFEVWYSGRRGMSRIDYYGGMDKTYQRGDLGKYGFACKVVPEYSEEKSKTFKGCLHRRGTRKFPIKPQSIIPSPKYFKFAGHVDFRGTPCAKWQHKFIIYNKVNTYTLYTSRSRANTPVRYEMMGYDTLLSSYYDHYILDYHTFTPWKSQYKVFEIPSDVKCFDFSHEKFVGAVGDINPMLEFMPHNPSGGTFSLPSTPEKTKTKKYSTEQSLKFLLEELNKMPFITTLEKTDTSRQHPSTRPTRTDSPSTTSDLSPVSLDGTLMSVDEEASYHSALRHYEDVVNHLFTAFKLDYKKTYSSTHEHERRKDIYRHNIRFIKSRNRQNLSYKLKLNHMADMTVKEVEKRKGILHNDKITHNGGKEFVVPNKDRNVPLPEHVDWRKAGAVNQVKSQGICGSCYAFAVAGALEGAYFIKTGTRLNLSEQQIVDCTWGFGNRGCKGGYPYRAMQWILKHGGLATEKSYGRYLAQEGYCHFKNTSIGAQLGRYMKISKGNTTELKMAVAFYGPVSILVNTQPKSFKFYASGIYYDPECTHSLDHAALAVGYGVEKGVPYWLVKNSWSKVWGEKGYIKIAMKDDNCGVAQKAVVVVIKTKLEH